MVRATRSRIAIGAVALAAGIALAFALPASWVFVEGAGDHTGHAHEEGAQYACPMFCVLMEELPADGRCPVCGMQMTRVSAESRLDAHERFMAGVEVTRLERRPLARTVRVVAEIDYDETRLSRITTRMSGWLEKVHVDAAWQAVRKGEPLAEIYSPELYAAQQEYLVAGSEGALRAAAERRLRLLGIGDAEIDALRERGTPSETLVLRAPRDGVVVERRAIEGASVTTGALLYAIADLDRVWLQAEVFERDLVWVREGQTAQLRFDTGEPDREGTVDFVDPALDRETRTARVRIVAGNAPGPDGRRPLRIGQRVDVRLRARIAADGTVGGEGGDPWAVPRSAVLSTGERDVIYVLFTEQAREGAMVRDYRLDPARLPDPVWYEMVPVRVGSLSEAEDGSMHYPLLDVRQEDAPALREGLVVVTKGSLLLDSQAQLSGRPSLLFPEGSRGAKGDPHAGH